MNDRLVWKEESSRDVYSCPVFTVGERICRSPDGEARAYTVLDTSDWAIVIPVLETGRGREFVMVRQWRHGAKELSLEFPGGVFEKGEDEFQAAARELREETAFIPGKIRKLGEFNPNPAIMSNTVHFFLAEDLKPTEGQDLDEDEFVEVETVPWEEVLKNMGQKPYIHALMGTALALFLQKVKI
ncbi:NUDIX hydrolase [Leadbettera azotonutricia]|uniref:GDP-mannose pyrophosphatase n=1 Tax=Leadbettera azotonutricia (strain ATCC BAA-888 / DSM 13862 / ZAS-9) TaxID=545695 RepID=F5YEQ7_LEAAZ|nr:NUDIX hydrolase [Leadbettera azotonutricia]AEF82650.1 MutT/NUDIX family protein [Leadbettera azotonutricia ZAS-9]